ncbi:MAG: ABC transporter permease subunit [Spirochaetes bacterium]|jgi:peptide/nickel transport system permease protein|nr:ABC transporter permease subunit [Spirochaetota bacterium]
MISYILRRLVALVPVVIFLSLFVFAIMKLTPGDPAALLAGPQASEEVIELTRARYGLDRPWYVQYALMMSNLFTGELESIYYGESVTTLVMQRLPATLQLGLAALVIALVVAIPAGIIAAIRRNTIFDYASMGIALFGVSIPVFFTGILLIYVFAVTLQWLPASGYGGPIWTAGGLRHVIMPAFALSLVLMASTTRLTRSSMLEVMSEDYMRTAAAKGASKVRVVLGHGLRNAFIPILTNIGNQFARLFAGAVLTETVFAWPGAGRLAINAIFRRDEPLVLATVLFLGLIYVFVNLFIDVLYTVINPRISYE